MKWNELLNRMPAPIRRRPVLLIGPVAVLVLLLALVLRPKPKETTTAYHEVKRGDFTVTVTEGGTLTAVSEVSHRNEVDGTARIIYIVPEGSYVKKDDLLVQLDSSSAQDQVNMQQINTESAQFRLAQAEAQLIIQQSLVDSEVRAAELKVRFAQLDLDKYDQGQKLVNLIEASNKVVQAAAQLMVNQETYRWSTNLAAKGYETKQKVEADRLTVLNNQNSVLSASNSLWMLQEFDIQKEREKFVSDFEEAKENLKRVRAQSDRKIDQARADLMTSSNTLVLNQKQLDRVRRNLAACEIRAKQDGLVVYPVQEGHFSSESLIEEGAIVRNRQELVKLPDVSKMKVTIKVHESHVGLVEVGQPAFVRLDSMPDRRFQGVVEKVAPLPDSQARWGNPNLKVYNTDVVVTEPLPGIKPGVSARAEIIITNIANALSVPIQAVASRGGRPVVYAQRGSRAVPVPVEVGMFNTKFIEIVSGLKEGEQVLLSPPFDMREKDLEGTVLAAEDKARAATNAVAARRKLARPGATNSFGVPRDRRPQGNGSDENGFAAADNGLGPNRPGQRNQPKPDELLKEFDKDGDGRLNDSERASMQLAMQTRFAGRGGAGGLPLSSEEMLKRFDKNGDGQLDDQERAAMRDSFGERGQRGRGPRPDRESANAPGSGEAAANQLSPNTSGH